MSTYKTFETDSSLETKGIKIDYGTAGWFMVARAGGSNKRFTKRFSQLCKPYRQAIAAGALPDDVADTIARDTFIDTCLLGWGGVTDPEGKELPFSKENARKLFSDLPDLFRELFQDSQNAQLFRKALLEEASGN